MENSNIYIDYEDLAAKIELLKKEKINMENVVQNLKSDFYNMINYWGGSTGEKVYDYLIKYSNDLPKIISQINREIVFLECVIDAYKIMDDSINKRLEDNFNIEM